MYLPDGKRNATATPEEIEDWNLKQEIMAANRRYEPEKRKNFFKKALLVGLTGLMIASGLGLNAKSNEMDVLGSAIRPSEYSQVEKMGDHLKEMGFDFNYNILFSKSGEFSKASVRDQGLESCKVSVDVASSDEGLSFPDVKETNDINFNNFKEVTKESHKASSAMNLFELAQGVGDCDVNSNPEIYNIFEDASLNTLFTQVEAGRNFKSNSVADNMGGKEVHQSLGDLLKEGYSEALGIILLQKTNLETGVKEVLVKKEAEALFSRHIGVSSNHEIVSHDYAAVYEFARMPTFQEKLNNANTVNEIRSLANEMSHYNFQQVVASKADDAIYSSVEVKRDAFMALRTEILKEQGAKVEEVTGFWKEAAQELKNSMTPEQFALFKEVVSVEKVIPIEKLPENRKNSLEHSYQGLFQVTPELTQTMNKITSLQDGVKDITKDVQVSENLKLSASEVEHSHIAESVIGLNTDYLKKLKEGPTLKEKAEDKLVEMLASSSRSTNRFGRHSSW